MIPSEKAQLLDLFTNRRRWCQGAEARDAIGEAVRFDDPAAVAWDITGALCLLFGWSRALELFLQLDEHVHHTKRSPLRSTNPEIESMAALQDRNDRNGTTFETIVEWLRTMPVWSGHHKVQ